MCVQYTLSVYVVHKEQLYFHFASEYTTGLELDNVAYSHAAAKQWLDEEKYPLYNEWN